MDKTIDFVLREHTQRLMEMVGVVGVGIGLYDGEPCIRVFVEDDPPRNVPEFIDGYRVDVLVTGEFRPLG